MEIAYKALNKDLTCTRGQGTYKYPVGEWVEEKEANVAQNGLHAAKCPLDCLIWYPDLKNSVYYIALCDGDISEDGFYSRISCTRMKLIRKLNIEQFVAHAVNFICEHPKITIDNMYLRNDRGKADGEFIIVRGIDPHAMATDIGQILALLKEDEQGEIDAVNIIKCDGDEYKPGIWYGINGSEESYE